MVGLLWISQQETQACRAVDNIKGYKGKRLALNVSGTWANNAVMLGMDTHPAHDQFFEFAGAGRRYDGELNGLRTPCQEVKITKINLYELHPYSGLTNMMLVSFSWAGSDHQIRRNLVM